MSAASEADRSIFVCAIHHPNGFALDGEVKDLPEVVVHCIRTEKRRDANGKDFIVFFFDVHNCCSHWVVPKRFSEFEALYEELQRDFPALKLPPLPPKKYFVRFLLLALLCSFISFFLSALVGFYALFVLCGCLGLFGDLESRILNEPSE